MKRILRRLRGMLGLGALWALIWTPIGVGITVLQFLAVGFGLPPTEILLALLVTGARNGFAAGFLFAGGLGIAYRKKGFSELTPRAMAMIGGLAGVLLPAGSLLSIAMSGFVPPLALIAITLGFGGALGASTGVASLKLAQAAPPAVEPGDSEAMLEP